METDPRSIEVYLDYECGSVLLKVLNGRLLPHHMSQLAFLGFERDKSKDLYERTTPSPMSFLPKAMSYLQMEGIKVSLSKSLLSIKESQDSNRVRFEAAKERGREFKEGRFDGSSFRDFQSFVGKHCSRKLKDHQLKAAYHHYLLRNAANFSVPGSGKTSVALAVYQKLKDEGVVNFLFVVGPPSCFGPWRHEFEATLGRQAKFRVVAGGHAEDRRQEYLYSPTKQIELYLTTFQTLLNDQSEVLFLFQQQQAKPFFVVDEAHYLKQFGGLWATAALSVSYHAPARCVLTGTPMPRAYSDVFNLFAILWHDSDAISSASRLAVWQAEKRKDYNSAKREVQSQIAPLYYRVRKSELGLRVPIFHPPLRVVMNKYERLIYNAVHDRISAFAKSDYLRNADLLSRLRKARIIRLRQCLSYPKLLLSALDGYNETFIEVESDLARIISQYDSLEYPAKLEILKNCCQEHLDRNEKVLVWSNFVGSLELISRYLHSHHQTNKLIYGKTPIEQSTVTEEETREQIIAEFLDPQGGLNVLLANPAACAESISLHKQCHHAIYYDLSYNCAQYLQSLDRIHRVGGCETIDTNYYFLSYDDSIDADIRANLEEKKARMYSLVEEDCAVYSLDMFEDSDDESEAYVRLFGA